MTDIKDLLRKRKEILKGSQNKSHHFESKKDGVTVSTLLSSHVYFLNWAFIVQNPDNYRLVLIRKGIFSIQREYSNLRSAKIGFSRIMMPYVKELDHTVMMKKMAKPDWTSFYIPSEGWLDWVMSEARKTQSYDTYNAVWSDNRNPSAWANEADL